jgi:hypothetical protein
VRQAFAAAGAVGWLLEAVGLEARLLPAAAAEAEAEARAAAASEAALPSSEEEDEDDEEEDGEEEDKEAAEGEAERGARGLPTLVSRGASPRDATAADVPAGAAPSAAGGGSGFAFTYDLNEDVERLMALEDALGREVALEVGGGLGPGGEGVRWAWRRSQGAGQRGWNAAL